ncbi:MAG: biotin-dependent carboxyltransferase family protein, partial [Rhizobiaceae bacterium]|nr:biotin-dependent carboxyltransferase family protein [Rhizobiaceae bacterium]
GLMNSVQDLGRPGYLDQGIGRGGAMDRPALGIANLLAGNDVGAAAIEVAVFPFRLRFLAPVDYAVTGALCSARLNGAELPPWWSGPAGAGDELRIDPPGEGARAYVALAGGIDVPEVLGARATDLKSVFGGLEGRALMRGDRLALGGARGTRVSPSGRAADPFYFRGRLGGIAGGAPLVLRIMPGAEFESFTGEAREALLSAEFTVSADNNRQGMRLEGPLLSLSRKLELFSHGIMPGTIQVPPSGQPVIQLAEANTCGGYPKIGHVIEPDLWTLGQAPPGARMRFEIVRRETAVAAIRDEAWRLRRFANLLAGQFAGKAG